MGNMEINFDIRPKIENGESSLLANDIVYRSVSIRCRYTLLKYDTSFLQQTIIFNSDKMTREMFHYNGSLRRIMWSRADDYDVINSSR